MLPQAFVSVDLLDAHEGKEEDMVLALCEVDKKFKSGDAKEGREPRLPTAQCQELALDTNLQVQQHLYLLN